MLDLKVAIPELGLQAGIHKKLIGHVCEHCGRQFVNWRPQARYCSRHCYLAETKKERYQCECIECKKEFLSRLPDDCYCSRKCYLSSVKAKTLVTCRHCGVRFARVLSRMRHSGIGFCSKDCWHEFQKATRRVCKECHHWYSSNMMKLHNSYMCQRIKKTIKAVEQKADVLRVNFLCARLNRAPDGEEALYYYRTLEDGSVFDPGDKIGSSPFQIIKARLPTADDW